MKGQGGANLSHFIDRASFGSKGDKMEVIHTAPSNTSVKCHGDNAGVLSISNVSRESIGNMNPISKGPSSPCNS